MLRPSIKRIGSLKYPLIDNPFYDERGKLIGENKLVELILQSENEANQNIFGGEFYILIQSAVIFGSLTERYKRKKIRLKPTSDIDLFLHIAVPYSLYSIFAPELSSILTQKYNSYREENIEGLFSLSTLSVITSQKRLGEGEIDQGLGFYIESYYPLNLER